MKKINYFKILADKTIKVIGFHGLNRFFYAYVSYDGKKILISNTETKNIPVKKTNKKERGSRSFLMI